MSGTKYHILVQKLLSFQLGMFLRAIQYYKSIQSTRNTATT